MGTPRAYAPAARAGPRHAPGPAGGHALGAFGRGARFVSVGPARRRVRFDEFSVLRWPPTRWGALVRAWGRLGSPGRWRASEYPDRAAAQPDVARAVRRRLGRGYRRVAVR